jgi:NAD(P)-dependent dehydrogenase (short-subunit alcohol dehydrogenase family)
MSETKPRVAIVTGAAGGIGRAMGRGLLAAGMRVAGVDRDRDPLEALAAAAREQGKGANLLTIQTDLAFDAAADEIAGATRPFWPDRHPREQRRDWARCSPP